MPKQPKPVKIVLAEDEPLIAAAYKQGLDHYGFEVILATDGEEALAATTTALPDILLLDIIMPRMNGIEVLKVLRGKAELSTLPVIVLTNLGQPEDADLVRELGAIAYLIKANLSLKELVRHINEAVGRQPT